MAQRKNRQTQYFVPDCTSFIQISSLFPSSFVTKTFTKKTFGVGIIQISSIKIDLNECEKKKQLIPNFVDSSIYLFREKLQ